MIARDAGDKKQEAESLRMVGKLFEEEQNYTIALGYYERAVPLMRVLQDIESIALLLHAVGRMYYRLHDISTALRYFMEVIALMEQINYPDSDRYRRDFENVRSEYRAGGGDPDNLPPL